MSSGWSEYILLVVAGGTVLLYPLVQLLVSLVMRPGPQESKEQAPVSAEKGVSREVSDRIKINPRFYPFVNATISLIATSLILIPCAASLHTLEGQANPQISIRALVAILSIVVMLWMGLFYASRKGDLSWLRSWKTGKKEDP